MKNYLLMACSSLFLFVSCTKNTTNVISYPLPAFTISGLANNNPLGNPYTITVQYNDSVQQIVSLSFSGIPTGIYLDTSSIAGSSYGIWLESGYPTFSSTFYLSRPFGSTIASGTYTITLIAKGTVSGTKYFPFTILVP